MKSVVLSILLLLHVASLCNGAKILMLSANMRSHHMYFVQMGKALAANGNDVTMLIGSKVKVVPELNTGDIKWVRYEMSDDPVMDSTEKYINSSDFSSTFRTLSNVRVMLELNWKESEQIFHDEKIMKTLEQSGFDFAVLDFLSPLLLVPYRLRIPYGHFAVDFDTFQKRVPIYPSYVPVSHTGYSDHMNFKERVINFVVSYDMPLVWSLIIPDNGLEDSTKFVPDRQPLTYRELHSKSSLAFTLRTAPLHSLRGNLPNMIDMGNIMGRPANPANIPADLRRLVDDAKDGFIVVSFGSWLNQPEETITKFIQAFEATKLTVLWRLKETPRKKLPANVHALSWIPQNDLLGEQNIRAFITHCGGSSILETTYHGVPVIGFPLGLDQKSNAQLMNNRKLGIIMDIADFSVSDLITAIQEVTNKESVYAQNMAKASAIFKALPDPGRTASFWINHVVQHGDAHLRASAFDLPLYQYLSLDVIAFLVVASYTIYMLGKMMCRKVCGCVCRRFRKDKME